MSVFGVFLVFIFRMWTEYGEIRRISPYSVRMRENKDQKKTEYGHFSRSVRFLKPHDELAMTSMKSFTYVVIKSIPSRLPATQTLRF